MKISQENNETKTSVVTYSDPIGKYGVILYSLKGGQPHEQIGHIPPKYSNKKFAQKAGKNLAKKTEERINLEFNLNNMVRYLSSESVLTQ